MRNRLEAEAASFFQEGYARSVADLEFAADVRWNHESATSLHRRYSIRMGLLIHGVLGRIPIPRDHFDLHVLALLVFHFQRAAVRRKDLHFQLAIRAV